jgi:hypothetical protein
MLATFDLDVRALVNPGAEPGTGLASAVLTRLGRWARFAQLTGLDGIGAVGRFSAMRGPGVLQALEGIRGADEGILYLDRGAAVVPGGALGTAEGVEVVLLGPPRALRAVAGSFSSSLFHGFLPHLADVLREAARHQLLVLVWGEGSSWRELLDMREDLCKRVHGVLSGPASPAAGTLERILGRPVAGASRAAHCADIGLRRTAVDLETRSFAALRSAFAQRAVSAMNGRGAIERAVVRSVAGVYDLLTG